MKKIIVVICTLISLTSYAQVVSDLGIEVSMAIVGSNGHQFEVTDGDFPGHYFDPEFEDAPPEDSYSYMWHTDEGNISNAEKPTFFFSTTGPHQIYLTLTPRKQGDKPKVFTTLSFGVESGNTSEDSHGNISDIDMYIDGQAREEDKLYVVIPLTSCDILGTHAYKLAYNGDRLLYSAILDQSNLEVGVILEEEDDALGISLNKKITFSYDWDVIRDDIAVVVVFDILALEEDEKIGLKLEKLRESRCDSDVEIASPLIRGPYDPNYKESDISVINVYEEPIKKINPTEVLYTIHFQNIGDAPVDSITVKDTLPLYLTFTSFEGSSEPSLIVSTDHTGGVLTWAIAPDADIKGTNQSPTEPEPTTRGWVSFKAEISKEEDIVYDTCHCLSNIATIYFDSLAAITTAADIIAVGDSLCFSPDPSSQLGELYAQTICGYNVGDSTSAPVTRKKAQSIEEIKSFIAYPNPSNGTFQLKGELEIIQRVEILNSLGQRVILLSKYETAINLDDQPDGLYFIRIVTEQQQQQVIRVEKH